MKTNDLIKKCIFIFAILAYGCASTHNVIQNQSKNETTSPTISEKTSTSTSEVKISQWQIDRASKIDCWWKCNDPQECTAGSLSVSFGTILAPVNDPEGKWIPPEPKAWTKICGKPCRYVLVSFSGFYFGGDCINKNSVEK